MITLESLNRSYERISNWENQYRTSLMEYLEKGIAFCNGKATLDFKYKSYQEAEEDGEEFDEQFPVIVDVEDKHGFTHPVNVTALYVKDGIFYVDGFDTYNDEWIEGWYTDSSIQTYERLAYFINEVLNPEEEEENLPEPSDEKSSFTAQIIGYQIVDEKDCYPSEFGHWDVFRSLEDAQAYIREMLDPSEWNVIEEWSTSHTNASMYTFHERTERSFKKGERVWIAEEFHNRFADIAEDTETSWDKDCVKVNELNTGDEWIQNWVRAGKIFKQEEGRICPECGLPLYRGYVTEQTGMLFCPECETDVKE